MSAATGQQAVARVCALPWCDRPSPDAEICAHDASKLRRDLLELPAEMDELQVTITRQAKGGSTGARAVGHEYALPFAEAAADDHWAIRNTVSTWARVVVEERYTEPQRVEGPPCWWIGCDHHSCARIRTWARWQRLAVMPVSFAGLCRWLGNQVEWLRHQQFALEAFDELLSIGPAVRRWTDTRSWRYLGACTAGISVMTLVATDSDLLDVVVTERRCGADLRLYESAKLIRCKDCGATYDARDHQVVTLLALRQRFASATEIAKALTDAGQRISAERIRKWASRPVRTGETTPVLDEQGAPTRLEDGQPVVNQVYRPLLVADRCRVIDKVPLYQIGDVLDLLQAKQSGQLGRRDAPMAAVS